MKKRGRPKGGAAISRDFIIETAFDLLETAGHQGMSMRALAKELRVTPMAIYSHFSDREDLIRGMSDKIYARVTSDFESGKGTPRLRLENLLTLYYEAIVRFPHLTILIFSSPTEFSQEVQKINLHLSTLLGAAKLKSAKKRIWLEILVDFTHGSALATASASLKNKSFQQTQKRRYKAQLKELLADLF